MSDFKGCGLLSLCLGKSLHPRLECVFVFVAFEFASGFNEALGLRSSIFRPLRHGAWLRHCPLQF